MLLFWRHGYESTSVSELVKAMGITPPSLYAAFGDKKELFREAVRRYLGGPVTAETVIRDAATAREAATTMLEGCAYSFTGQDTPSGCLLASATISCSAAAADVQRELAAIRGSIERRLKLKIEADIRTGALPPEMDAGAWAAQVMAMIQGMSTLARDGGSRVKLLAVAKVAMLAWGK